jgi:peptide/nickel transport system permease protein
MIGVPIGIWSATGGGVAGGLLNLVLSFLLAVPELLSMIVLLVFAARTGDFPVGGMTSTDFDSMTLAQKFRDIAWHMALPVAILISGILPVIVRHVRASMAEVLGSTFALNAQALGISRRRLWFRHLLPAALNPLISLAGLSFGTLLSASLLIEVVAGWPGLGPLFVDAVMARDFALVLAVVMLASAFLITGNLLADILLYNVDPRIRDIA